MTDDRSESDFYWRALRASSPFDDFGYNPERTDVGSHLCNLAHALVTAPYKYETLISIIREETKDGSPLLQKALDALDDVYIKSRRPATVDDLYSVAEVLLASKEDAPILAAQALAGALETDRLHTLSIRNATGGPSLALLRNSKAYARIIASRKF